MKYLVFGLLTVLLSCSQGTRKSDNQSKQADSIKIKQDSVVSLKDSSGVVEDELDTIVTTESGESFIKGFYEEYLSSIDKGTSDEVKLEFCTPELITKLSENDLSYDPFINAQDFDESLLKTLDVKKSDAPQGYYVASYLGYRNKKVYIAMSLEQRKGGYKISDLILSFEPEKN